MVGGMGGRHMRIPLLRLLLVGGGAAVLATAGFAYMAANTVPASSLGEGSGPVTGYTVSNITYTTTFQGPAQGPPYFLATVSFTLSGANMPVQVNAAVDPGGPGGPPPPPPGPWVNLACHSTSSWSNGSGSFTCTVPSGPPGHQVPVSAINTLDVEANQ